MEEDGGGGLLVLSMLLFGKGRDIILVSVFFLLLSPPYRRPTSFTSTANQPSPTIRLPPGDWKIIQIPDLEPRDCVCIGGMVGDWTVLE